MPSPTGLKPRFPIHDAIRDTKRPEQSVLSLLRAAYKLDPCSLSQTDNQGRTPIAVAAMSANLAAIDFLLELARKEMAEGDDLLGLEHSDNLQETPASHNLLMLQENPRFRIHDALTKATQDLHNAFIRNRLPPCLCGKCVGGWFSPRMRFRLRETANEIQKLMRLNLANFTDGNRLEEEAMLSDPVLPFLPSPLTERGVYKPFYVGFRASFQAIADVLNQTGPDSVPTVQRLRLELADGARAGRYDLGGVEFFAERGGSAKYALEHVIHQALWESPTPLGDGSFDKKWDEPLQKPFALARLPVPNDTKEAPRRRSRSVSVSFKGVFKPFGERRNSMGSKRNDPVEPKRGLSSQDIEDVKRWKLKEEWDASGDPGCPLDTQFGGVRYMLGIHEEARWEIALDDVDARGKRPSCELRRV